MDSMLRSFEGDEEPLTFTTTGDSGNIGNTPPNSLMDLTKTDKNT